MTALLNKPQVNFFSSIPAMFHCPSN